jgi:ribosomal protein S12 methylthiotransferase
LSVLVDGLSEDNEFLLEGRHEGQAPEIDGVVYLSDSDVAPGEFVQVTITEATSYDLVGQAVEPAQAGAKARPQPRQTRREQSAPSLIMPTKMKAQ